MVSALKQKIIEVVNLIPEGRVSSYGRVAQVVNILWSTTVTAQLIGWQLSGMKPEECEQLARWRVVNKKWVVTSLKLGEKWLKQIALLESRYWEWIILYSCLWDEKKYSNGYRRIAKNYHACIGSYYRWNSSIYYDKQ